MTPLRPVGRYAGAVGESSPISAARFGRYALGPELGAGGMATVTFGVATGALGFARPVAIKRIHPTLVHDSTSLREAIRDEARIAARVRHPNVVAVLDVIEEGDEVGIVLEYVHGDALSSLLRRSRARQEPLPLGVAIAIVVDMLHGLHAAHSAVDEAGAPLDIVHRDVSPQNVIVGSDGVARVLDFGISKAENRASVTRDGNVKGKLRYMAPEQVAGEASSASDTYAAGLVLWEALAGHSPFEDGEQGVHAVARALMGVSVAVSAHRPDVPPALDGILAKALALEPRARFGSAAEMAAALEATGLVASRTHVAACVNDLAKDDLEARARVVALLERGMSAAHEAPRVVMEKTSADAVVRDAPADGRRSRLSRLLPWALAALLGLTAIWLGLGARRATRAAAAPPADPPVTASIAVSPPAAVAPASAVAPPAASVVAPAPGPSTAPVARPAGKLRKARPGAPPDCAVPYTVDPSGDRHYRRECFE
jgi:serine/threonine-protein kinase